MLINEYLVFGCESKYLLSNGTEQKVCHFLLPGKANLQEIGLSLKTHFFTFLSELIIKARNRFSSNLMLIRQRGRVVRVPLL